ncbi:MAG: hypothetical protein Q8M31_01695 [Beijerinckiaceae bacterium]|nr:hypothetical protein [Beijerinckiaceae bacterium]
MATKQITLNRYRTCFAVLASTSALAFTTPSYAQAQDPANFYSSNKMTMVVGSSVGGGYDLYGRIVARFIGNHIPGKPSVTVRNMPGAGSLTSVIYVATSAPTDGTVIGIFNPGIITDAISRPGRSKINFTELAWIGSATDSFRMCNVWHGSGIKNYDDLGGARVVTFGASGVGSGGYNDVAILKNLMKLNVRPILGYPGRAEVHLAMERGEVDGECGTADGMPESWITEKKVITVLKTAPGEGYGIPPGTTWLGDRLKSASDIAVLNFLTAANQIGRPFIASNQVPADRLATLRAAFDATMKDKAFLAQAEAQKAPINPATGAQAEKIVAEIYKTPTDIAARANEIIK